LKQSGKVVPSEDLVKKLAKRKKRRGGERGSRLMGRGLPIVRRVRG